MKKKTKQKLTKLTLNVMSEKEIASIKGGYAEAGLTSKCWGATNGCWSVTITTGIQCQSAQGQTGCPGYTYPPPNSNS